MGVLTSEDEGMPVALMEAGACGVPVVATAVGGIPELIEDRVTGLLAIPDDHKSVAKALQRLLENKSLASQMGQAARHRIEKHFSLTGQVDRLLGLWSELAHG
jgi:glycosyltransferase involved in cell wall biosynthesis